MGMVSRINAALKRVPVWSLYIAGPAPLFWFYYLGLTNQLGADPVKVIEHRLGLIGLQLIIAGLMVTPLRRFAGVNLFKLRRAIGLLAFFYIAGHLMTWLVLDIQLLWGEIWKDILKRPYITIGMSGFALMLPLAITSNNWSVRRLGPAWRRLHRLTYIVAVLGAVHFVMLVKGYQIEPLIYLAIITGLLATRVKWSRAVILKRQ